MMTESSFIQKPTGKSFSGNDLPNQVWAEILAPLSLIDDLKLESVCKAFSETIYTGQNRFIWCKKFQDFLYRKYKMNRTPEDENAFLLGIARKIGPHCRQFIFKLYNLPSNHRDIFASMEKLTSLYLKIQYLTDDWKVFFSKADEFKVFGNTSQGELRVVMVQENPDYMPQEFSTVLKAFSENLCSIQIWQSEQQFTKDLVQMSKLRKLRLFLNKDLMQFFALFAGSHKKLDQLYVKWEEYQITPDLLNKFAMAMSQLSQLRLFSLEIDWIRFNFKTDGERNDFKAQLAKLTNNMPKTISKLSIDVQHPNFRTMMSGSELVSQLSTGLPNMKILRVVATARDVFPLKIALKDNDTIEVVFTYVKVCRQIAPFLILQNYRNSLLPPHHQFNKFLFEKTSPTEGNNVVCLKLKHCPSFSMEMVNHIVHCFPELQKFYFYAFHLSMYTHKYSHKGLQVDFTFCLKELLNNCPKLRVIKLGDNFEKIDMGTLMSAFIKRASLNRTQHFALYIDKLKNCKNVPHFMQSLRTVKNLRIF